MHQLGYRPNRSARALRNQRSRLIGVKVEASRDDRAALLLDQFLHALAESARGAGSHLILCQADDEAERDRGLPRAPRHHRGGRVRAGQHPRRRPPGRRRCASWQVPFATFGRSWDGDEELAWVDVDGRAGIRAATEHVAAQGHRRIAYVGWPLSSETGRDRRQGWLDALR